jgi:hypothetical protein
LLQNAEMPPIRELFDGAFSCGKWSVWRRRCQTISMKVSDGGELLQAIEERALRGVGTRLGGVPVDRRAVEDGACEIVERTFTRSGLQ